MSCRISVFPTRCSADRLLLLCISKINFSEFQLRCFTLQDRNAFVRQPHNHQTLAAAGQVTGSELPAAGSQVASSDKLACVLYQTWAESSWGMEGWGGRARRPFERRILFIYLFFFPPFFVLFLLPGRENAPAPPEVHFCRTHPQQSKCPDISNPRRAGKSAELHTSAAAAAAAANGEEAELLMSSVWK